MDTIGKVKRQLASENEHNTDIPCFPLQTGKKPQFAALL